MRAEQGVVLPFFALFLIAALGMGALVIDIGSGYSVKTKIQNAVDLSVLAGSSQINSGSSVTTVKNTALNYLNNNLSSAIPSFQTLSLTSPGVSIQVGTYDTSTMTFVVNEAIPPANAIKVSYTHMLSTFFAPIFMIDTFDVGEDAIAVKKPAGYMAPGTGFPLAIYSSALTTALSNNNMVNLYSSGMSDNSYWTDFTSSNPSTTDIRNVLDYFQYGTGTKPPAVTVNDSFAINDGGMGGIFMNLEPSILEGMTYLFSVVEDMASMTAMAQGFVGATIDDIVDSMGERYVSITIIPGFVDNTFGGLGIASGPGSDISSENQALLANSYGLGE